MPRLADSIGLQAARYGRLIRELEDAGLESDRRAVRQAWHAYRQQLQKSDDMFGLLGLAMNRYYDAYCEE